MTAVPQSRIESDLRELLAARDATIDRQARGLAGDAEMLDDCGPTARRAMETI